MLQRIQTLFLSCVFIAYAACFFLPFWKYIGANPDYTYQVDLFAVRCLSGESQNITLGTLPILLLAAVSAILSIVSLAYYKNRPTQIKINNYNLLLTLIFTGTIYLWIPYMLDKGLQNATSQWQQGLILPLISLVLLVLANVFIKKDEKLVKSTERLR